MKRFALLIVIIVCAFFTLWPTAHATDLLVGAKVWYAYWDPVLKDVGKEVPWMGWQHLEIGDGLLFGPSLGILITDDISLSVAYLYGKMESQFDASYRAEESDGSSTYDRFTVARNDITRQDIDSALSFRIVSWLKIFAGFKYQTVDMTMKQASSRWLVTGTGEDGVERTKMDFDQLSYSPAIGLGFSFPLSELFAFTANVSVLYMMGEQDISHRSEHYYASDFDTPHYGKFDLSMDLEGYGINIDPAILLFLKDINLVLVLGFRYQYVKYDGTWDTPPENLDDKIEDMSDALYGVHFSVLYKL